MGKVKNKTLIWALAVVLCLSCLLAGCGTKAGQQESQPDQTRQMEQADQQEESAQEGQVEIDRDGTYDSKEEVALYLYTYGELPSNYITKKEARKLGWDGGPLEPYAPGKCIGGDYYGNYEGNLPDGDYHECDIDSLGKKRGAERLVYSEDEIYYSPDHYNTFEQLYDKDGEVR